MNLSRNEATALARAVAPRSGTTIAVFPPICFLESVGQALRGSAVHLGAQNCSEHASGAFTGEISGEMVRELNATWVLMGHSERRWIFGDSNLQVGARCKGAIRAGLKPTICVGERLADHNTGRTKLVVREQLEPCLEAVGNSECVIAYEPVWAIGTGKIATADQIAEVILMLKELSGGRPVLYGGSVTPDNAAALATVSGLSGFLVGGSSLDAEKFNRIGAML